MECSNRECSILLCQGCLSMQDPKCPGNCGSNQFNKPNRIVMQQLQGLKFKCQYVYDGCTVETPYKDYEKHLVDCPVGKDVNDRAQQCTKESCKAKVESLDCRVRALEERVAEAEEDTDRKKKMVEALRQNLAEQKQQLKDMQNKQGNKVGNELIEYMTKIENLQEQKIAGEQALKKAQRERDVVYQQYQELKMKFAKA